MCLSGFCSQCQNERFARRERELARQRAVGEVSKAAPAYPAQPDRGEGEDAS